MSKNKTLKYIRQYQWSDIFAMIRNNMRDPKICEEKFEGKLVVITGATSGIGKLTARKFASMGANLLCINRNPQKSEQLKKELEEEFHVKCDFFTADLSELEDINKAADFLNTLNQNIDVLIHNAGVFLTKREVNSENLEKVWVVHYLSSFIINFKLMEKLRQQNEARIIYVGSEGHRFAVWGIRTDDLNWEKRRYSGMGSYGSAKTAQLLSMHIFARHFEHSGVTINTMHPGAVRSETGQENGAIYRWYKRNVVDKMLKPADVSAEALYYLGVSDEIKGLTDRFFNLTSEEMPTPPSLDAEVAEELWEISLKMSKIKNQNP